MLTIIAISFLNSRANAIKMLQSRIAVIVAYLKAQPATYLTDPDMNPSDSERPDHEILRSIAALEAQLRLTAPADVAGISQESNQSKTDVELISLLSGLTKVIGNAKSLTRKWTQAETAKRRAMMGGFSNSQMSDMQGVDEIGATITGD
jgi:COP9 signalosome complex subunit 6